MCEYITEWPPPNASDSEFESKLVDPIRDHPYQEEIILLKDMIHKSSNHKKAKLDMESMPQNAKLSLAKWARQNHLLSSESVPSKHNVKTRLNILKRTPEGAQFLAGQALAILEHFETNWNRQAHFQLATYFHELTWYESAWKAIKIAIKPLKSMSELDTKEFWEMKAKLSDEECEMLWWHEKLTIQCQMRAQAKVRFTPMSTAKRQVPRIAAKDLSVEVFRQEFVRNQKPVIITQAVSKCVEEPWTLDLIRSVGGEKEVVLKRFEKDSLEWARLEPSVTWTVDKFINGIHQRDDEALSLYLFDWSLPLFCPELNRMFKVPDYFEHDYLKKTSEHALYRQSWPSLFVAPKGVKGGLHVDAFASNFWMILFQGKKKWTFFDPEAIPHLKPCYDESLDPVFDLKMEDTAKLVALGVFEIILEPGELLFVPRGSPHLVENLEDSVAVSGNFVDDSNIEETKHHLKVNGLLDPRALDLLKEFGHSHL